MAACRRQVGAGQDHVAGAGTEQAYARGAIYICMLDIRKAGICWPNFKSSRVPG